MTQASQPVNLGRQLGEQAKVSVQLVILILIVGLHVITTMLNDVGWS